MDPVEKAIRTALEKGDADERSFREGVYRKAFAALERALESNPVTLELAQRRRSSVQAKIAEIESEYIPAFPSLDTRAPDVAPPRAEPASPPPFARPGDVYAPPAPEPAPPPRYAPPEPSVDPEPRGARIPPLPPRADSSPLRPEQVWRTGDRVEPSFDASTPRGEPVARPEPPMRAEPAMQAGPATRAEPVMPEPSVHAEPDVHAEPAAWAHPEPETEPPPEPAPAWSGPDAHARAWEHAEPEPAYEPAPAVTWSEEAAPVEHPDESPVHEAPEVDTWQAEPGPVAAAPEVRVGTPAVATAPAASRTLEAAPVGPAVETDIGGAVPRSFFPDLDDFGAPGTKAAVAADAVADESALSAGGGPNVARERRRPFAAIFIVATLLAAVGIGVWWGITTGLFKTPEEIAGDEVPNPPVVVEEEDFDPDEDNAAPQLPGEADAERNWVSVFTPDDPTIVSAPGDTSAEVMEDDSGEFLRIRSGASGSSVSFDVGQGILEQIAGKHAVFDITARSEEGKETQFAVDCNFGELGDCGRKRYAAGYAKGDFLFEMELPAKSPGANGTIAINPDIAGEGKALDIFEIRVSAGQ